VIGLIHNGTLETKRIEYILEWNLLEKKCKTAILLYCFHTAGVLHIFALYNILGLYSPNSVYKVYLTALKNSNLKWIV